MDIEKIEESIKDLEVIELNDFPIEMISKESGTILRCIKDDGRPYSIRVDEPYAIYFNEPAYVSDIQIVISDKVIGSSLKLKFFDSLSNKDVRVEIDKDLFSEEIRCDVERVVSGFSITLDNGFITLFKRKTLEIKKIIIWGYSRSDFEDISEKCKKILRLKDSAVKEVSDVRNRLEAEEKRLKEKEESLREYEKDKKNDIAALEAVVEQLSHESSLKSSFLEDLKIKINESESELYRLREQESTFQNNINSIEKETLQGKEELMLIMKNKAEMADRLKELTSNVNLFSEEFSSFSDHGAKQANIFIWLAIIPILVIVALTIHLLIGAVDLSVKYTKEPNIDVFTVFVTRLPYLMVCGSILAVCYSIVKFLFERVSEIYAERLDFSKIGIVAKDISYASASGLNMTDEQVYEAKTYAKIEILKSYLSGNIGKYTYKKRQVIDDVKFDSEFDKEVEQVIDRVEDEINTDR
ncbi:hypothetical protein ACXHWJ_06375 [Alcaligenes nematophilus]